MQDLAVRCEQAWVKCPSDVMLLIISFLCLLCSCVTAVWPCLPAWRRPETSAYVWDSAEPMVPAGEGGVLALPQALSSCMSTARAVSGHGVELQLITPWDICQDGAWGECRAGEWILKGKAISWHGSDVHSSQSSCTAAFCVTKWWACNSPREQWPLPGLPDPLSMPQHPAGVWLMVKWSLFHIWMCLFHSFSTLFFFPS